MMNRNRKSASVSRNGNSHGNLENLDDLLNKYR